MGVNAYRAVVLTILIASFCAVVVNGDESCDASRIDCRDGENYLLTNAQTSNFQEKSQTRMDLLYSSPLALTFQYLSRWFYKETPVRSLFKEFFEADRRNVDLGYDAKKDEEEEDYDFIVVGSGSAGSAVVHRLAMDKHNYKVLLLEVGGNQFPLSGVPALLFELLNNPEIDWSDVIVPQKGACKAFKNDGVRFQRGKGIGGSPNLNWMVAMRGNPNDFDRWANESGDPQWTHKNLLPFFKKMETYRGDFPIGEYHGTDGPLNVDPNRFAPLHEEWMEVGKEMGYKVKDPNAEAQDESFFPFVFSMKDGTRFSVQRAYVYPASRRPNLTIRPYSTATKIEFDDSNRAVGIHYETVKADGTRVKRYAGAKKEIVLSAGVFGSPKLLMLSGIGPKEHLESLGIPSRIDLPVGQNLQDHALFFIGPFSIDKSKTARPNLDRDFNEDTLHEYVTKRTGPFAASGFGLGGGALIASSFGTEAWPDLYYSLMSMKMKADTADFFQKTFGFKDGVLQKYFRPIVGKDAFFHVLCLNLPKTVGEVKLKSKNPHDTLHIDPNYLDHEDDVQSVLEGVKFALRMTQTKALQKIDAKLTPTLFPGCESHGNADYDNDGYWECFFRHMTQTMWHYTSTVKMGSGPKDKTSVVDSNLRVVGTKGLRVIDNSIQPKVVTTNTNLPAIVIGEKGADLVLNTWA